MIEAWFEVEQARYVTLVALSALVALLAPFISKGVYRPFVMSVWMTLAGIGFVLLTLAAIAYSTGQPSHVVSTLFKGGIALSIAFSVSLFGVKKGYRDAELRKMTAHDL